MSDYYNGQIVYVCPICKDNLFVPSRVIKENGIEYEFYKKCVCYDKQVALRKQNAKSAWNNEGRSERE